MLVSLQKVDCCFLSLGHKVFLNFIFVNLGRSVFFYNPR